MLDSESEIVGGLHPDRKQLITGIQRADQQAFEDWASKNKAFRQLPTEAASLRYLIPPRIWDFVSDQRRLDVLVTKIERGREVQFCVVEHTGQSITNINSLREYDEGLRNLYHGIAVSRPKPPLDVDEIHLEQKDLVLKGVIPVTDKVYNVISLKFYYGEDLHVVTYSDRSELRRKGIATSFYQRLREVAKELGFRYITGINSSKNESFFKGKLGRTSLDQLPESFKGHLGSYHAPNVSDSDFTVDFINPEDKPHPSK